MNAIIAMLLKLQPAVQAGLQIYETIDQALGLINKASAENRDLSDAEMAEIEAKLAAVDSAWAEQLAKLRAQGGSPA